MTISTEKRSTELARDDEPPRFRVPTKLALALVALVAAAVTLLGPMSATASIVPETLMRASVIRADITARYRLVPGRKLVVTEASTTGVVQNLTLVTDWLELPRLVPADNGIYFAICSARAKCPYPARSAAWPAGAFLPRRQALELALRTFVETSANLVVVALPTARPVWLVIERDDLLAELDAPGVFDCIVSKPALINAQLKELVDRLTLPRLFVPLPILPPPRDTIYAVRLFPD